MKKPLKKVYIEITNICNLNCSFCATTNRKKEFMDIETFAYIIDSIKQVTDSVYFHVLGEPLLHDGISDFLDICYEKKINVSITTNAFLLQKRRNDLVGKKALRQINYSLHSILENEKNYEEFVDEVLKFIDYANSNSNTEFYNCLRLWSFGYSASANEMQNKIFNLICSHYNFKKSIDEIIGHSGNGTKISENVFLQLDKRFTWPSITKNNDSNSDTRINNEHGKCNALRHNIAILVDGTVVPCCLDANADIPLGNILETPIEEILCSERAKKIYDGFTSHKPTENLCKTCGFLKRLNGKRNNNNL